MNREDVRSELKIGSFRAVTFIVWHDYGNGTSQGTEYRTIECLTCKQQIQLSGYVTPKDYGIARFRPLDHDPHCPARNHVYLEGIGPMIEPRAMVFDKEEENGAH